MCVKRGYISITISMAIAQAQFTSRESKMVDYVFLPADSADEKILMLMLMLMLMYARFTPKYSQRKHKHKHKKMEKVPFLVLMLMLMLM